MSLVTFKCPWCSAEIQMQINEVTVTDTLTLKAIEHEESTVSKIPVYNVRCRLCLAEYEPIKVSDYIYIKSHLKPQLEMLQTFKTKFPTQSIEAIFDNIVAITRPKKSISEKLFARNPHLHIFFILDGVRAYVDCEQVTEKRKTILRGLDIEEV